MAAYILSALGIGPSVTVTAPLSTLTESNRIHMSPTINSITSGILGTLTKTHTSISAPSPPSAAFSATKDATGIASRAGISHLLAVIALASMLFF
jgi:hypothetical protein